MEEKNLVTLPSEAVAYLEYMKRNNYTLLGALKLAGHNSEMNKYMDDYLNISSNQENFALAWINGYKVEEKFYTVKITNIAHNYSYLNMELIKKTFYFASQKEVEGFRTSFTKEELEKAGFAWVFNCEGIEIIEVDDD